MITPERGAGAEGVGIAYHPFLHDLLLANTAAFAFVELPLDLYIDPARTALLDPMDAKLRAIAAARPCVWRGSALSLGSVENADDPAPDPWIARRIGELLEKVPAIGLVEEIGFRALDGHDLGLPQNLPFTETAADWIAARALAADAVLGHAPLLQLSATPIPAPRSGWDAAAFMHRITAESGCGFVLDCVDLTRFAVDAGIDPAAMARRMPGGRIALLASSGERDEDWGLLSMLLAHTAARGIVIRRSRNLFPLDAIIRDAHRAAALLEQAHDRAHPAAPPDIPAARNDPGGLAELRAYQSAFIGYCLDPAPERMPPALADAPEAARQALLTRVDSWQTWQTRVAETHKAQQIMKFLAMDAGYGLKRGA